jgi:hypothetical protein
VIVLLVSCSSRTPYQTQATMPNPEGCFVQVWDAPQYGGVYDYINGPRVYTTLRQMPGGRQWNDRVRSLRVPRGAVGVAYTDENLQGTRMPLRGGQEYPTLPLGITGDIESLEINCPPAARDVPGSR